MRTVSLKCQRHFHPSASTNCLLPSSPIKHCIFRPSASMASLGIRSFVSASKVCTCRLEETSMRGHGANVVECDSFQKQQNTLDSSLLQDLMVRLSSLGSCHPALTILFSSNHSQPTAPSQRGISIYEQQVPNNSMPF